MRIVGGQHRGRKLLSPEGLGTRPTKDSTRESLFNILAHAGWLPGPILDSAQILDAFAGTGALGLEALSRGGSHAVFIEHDRRAADTCRQNIAALKEENRTVIITADATSMPPRPHNIAPRTLVFLDPPYGKNLGVKALTGLAERGWLAPGAVCILEMAAKAPEETPDGFTMHDERHYGIALIRFITWS